MSVVYALAVFFLIWWIVLFAILPFGLRRTQEEAGEVLPGSEPSAPERPQFLKVIVITTIVASVIFTAYVSLRNSGFGLDDIPFLNPPGNSYSQPGS
ncbi:MULTISPECIES: DUF1467 family protein [Stappiaceae]|uniref:DUF1467 family protein n=1 Tax=Stappiaceae TaxID=2821832 RepID=UPI000B8C6768|nr:DUF1467 family protein [Labrenzia sp. VG12]ASP33006.1 hypothetical protein CHH27_06855 [Labrenzia sp. VG12]